LAAISSAPQPRDASARRTRPRSRGWRALLTTLLIGCDMLAVNSAFIGTFALRYDVDFAQYEPPTTSTWLVFLALFNVAFALAFASNGLYTLRRGISRVDEGGKLFIAVSLGTLSVFLINTLLTQFRYGSVPLPAATLAWGWASAMALVLLLRLLHRALVSRLRRNGIDTRRVLIVGSQGPGRVVWKAIRRLPELGYQAQGFLSDVEPIGALVDDLPVLGRTSALGRVVRATRPDEVILAISGYSPANLLELVEQVEDEAITVKVYPDTFQLITNNGISVGDLSGLPLVPVKNVALDSPVNRVLKRSFDILFSAALLVAISPLLLLVAALIKLDSPGPAFLPQQRVGMDGKLFYMIKFRSMRADADSTGPGWTVPNDPRVTRLGRFLRRHSIDELPQFINVLLGEMSVVGPRAEQPAWVERFSKQIPRYKRRHREKVGITGWAQVNGLRGDTSIEERTHYDLYYVENWSLLFDIKIILKTVIDVLTGKQENAY
jgi:exopolysaccharide biosynthesis polyprenyl glycosylphosphotransferase